MDDFECGEVLIVDRKLFDIGDGRAFGEVGKQNEVRVCEEHEFDTAAMEGSNVDSIGGGSDFKNQVEFWQGGKVVSIVRCGIWSLTIAVGGGWRWVDRIG